MFNAFFKTKRVDYVMRNKRYRLPHILSFIKKKEVKMVKVGCFTIFRFFVYFFFIYHQRYTTDYWTDSMVEVRRNPDA